MTRARLDRLPACPLACYAPKLTLGFQLPLLTERKMSSPKAWVFLAGWLLGWLVGYITSEKNFFDSSLEPLLVPGLAKNESLSQRIEEEEYSLFSRSSFVTNNLCLAPSLPWWRFQFVVMLPCRAMPCHVDADDDDEGEVTQWWSNCWTKNKEDLLSFFLSFFEA